MISLIRCKKSQVDSITLETDFEDSWFAWLSPLHANEEGKKEPVCEWKITRANQPSGQKKKARKKGKENKKNPKPKLGRRPVTFVSSA